MRGIQRKLVDWGAVFVIAALLVVAGSWIRNSALESAAAKARDAARRFQLMCQGGGVNINMHANRIQMPSERVFVLTDKDGNQITFVAPITAACLIGELRADATSAPASTSPSPPSGSGPKIDL